MNVPADEILTACGDSGGGGSSGADRVKTC